MWNLPFKFDIALSPLGDVSLANTDVKRNEILNVIDRSWKWMYFFYINN